MPQNFPSLSSFSVGAVGAVVSFLVAGVGAAVGFSLLVAPFVGAEVMGSSFFAGAAVVVPSAVSGSQKLTLPTAIANCLPWISASSSSFALGCLLPSPAA
jgi:hypothetical protein